MKNVTFSSLNLIFQMMEALKQKAMDERLRDVEGADRRVR